MDKPSPSQSFHFPLLTSRQLRLSATLCLSVCGASPSAKPHAMAVDPGPASSATERAVTALSTPVAPPSGPEVAEAFRSSNAGPAVNLLMRVHCIPDTDAVQEVRRAWVERESFTSSQAMHDELLRTYAAKCVVVSSQTVPTDDAVKDSAATQLRQALIGPNIRAAQVAMLGMRVIATNDDVETIATLAVQKPEIAIAAAGTLSIVCGPTAAAAVQRIVAFYEGNELSPQLETVVSQQRSTRASLCGLEGGQAGMTMSPKPVMLPGAPDAANTREALTAASRADAVKTLLALRCSADTTGASHEMLRAWRDRDSAHATAITRDPLVRAIMARCILWSGPESGESQEDRADAADVLRSAIYSDDRMTVVVSLEGLTRTSLQLDLMGIAETPRRIPGVRTPALWDVSVSCAPNPEAALAELRSTASTSAERENVDKIFESYAPNRRRLCANE